MSATMTSAIRIMQLTSFLEFPRNYQITRITTELSASGPTESVLRQSENYKPLHWSLFTLKYLFFLIYYKYNYLHKNNFLARVINNIISYILLLI